MDSMGSSIDEDRLNILRMVEDGKLSANEAASLLNALSQGKYPEPVEQPVEPPAAPTAPRDFEEPAVEISNKDSTSRPQWLRVRVTDLSSGRRKVTVNLPFGLVNWGMKIGARYAPEIEGLDFNELSELLQAGADGKLVDVVDEEDGEHVEVYID